MAMVRLSDAVLRATMRTVAKHGGSREKAGAALGIPATTIRSRVAIARARGMRVPAVNAVLPAGKIDPYAAPLREERSARQEAERRLRLAEQALAEERAATARWRDAKVPTPTAPRLRPPHKDDLRRAIIPDSHGWTIDPAAKAAALGDIKALDPDEIVMLGDHVDCAGFLAAHHLPWTSGQLAYTYESDIAACARFLDEIQAAAPRARIHYIEGNHEARVEWWANRQALQTGTDAELLRRNNAPEFMLKLEPRGISYYRRAIDYGLGVPGALRLGKVAFVHDPGKKVQPEHQAKAWGLSLVYGHTHTAVGGIGRVVANGDLGAWCPGCLCQRQPLYAHTNPTNWTHGIAVQVVARSGRFLHAHVPIISGESLLPILLKA
jgi:hypothetical protein